MIQCNCIGEDPDEDLLFGKTDAGNTAKLDEITMRICEQQRFKCITHSQIHCWGGGKNPETTVFAAAFNYFQLGEFFEELEKLEWQRPDLLRVFVQRQESNAFGVWIMCDGKMTCVLSEAE